MVGIDYLQERPGTILIAPSYTEEEYMKLNDKNVPAKDKPQQPPYFVVTVLSIDNIPHRRNIEDFESFQGRIPIEKACDQYAELTVEILVSSRHLFSDGLAKVNDETIPMQVLEGMSPGNLDQIAKSSSKNQIGICPAGPGPEYDTRDFIELRRNLLSYLDGRYMTLVSNLFDPIPVAYITDKSYTISEGEEVSLYNVEFKEYVSFER